MNRTELTQVMLCVNSNLRKASRAVTQFYSDTMEGSGLLQTQFSVLAAIGIMGETTVTELAERSISDQTTMTRSVNIFVKNGWVTMTPSAQDKRVKLIRLTEDGRAMLDEAFPLWQKAQQTIVDALGQEDADLLVSLLEKVAAAAQEA